MLGFSRETDQKNMRAQERGREGERERKSMCLGGIFNAIRKPIAMLANGFPRSQWPRTEGEMRECGLTLQLQHVVPRATEEMQASSPVESVRLSSPLLSAFLGLFNLL